MLSHPDLSSRLSSLSPSEIDSDTFLELVEILDGKFQHEENSNVLFKTADKLLTEFAKAPTSWEIVF